jgi:hypothetical protein
MGHSNQSYTEMYSGWPPANDGMIPPLIWRYINDNTTGLPQVTTTQLSSRSVEDQEESETNKNRPPPQPVSPRKKKSSKKKKEATKRKHGGEEPDGSDSSDSDTVESSESDTDDDGDIENGVHVITNTMTIFSTDYRIRSKQSRKIAQIQKNYLRLQERIN